VTDLSLTSFPIAETALPRSSPEQQGVESASISALLTALDDKGLELHSLMLLRHGHVVAEGWWAPYKPAGVHLLYSLSKSFTSTAVGLAVQEGLLRVEDLVTSFFPDSVPEEVHPRVARMTVRHLLCMATGHREDTLERIYRRTHEVPVPDIVRAFLSLPPEEEPGSWFTYNNGATMMLSAIVTKVSGQRLLDYLRPRLLEPLGIVDAYWAGFGDLDQGFSGLHLQTHAIAAFGQLYLQQGSWQGRQLIPRDWVSAATRPQVANPREPEIDWRQGYGYQFWMCRHDAYRGDGAYGQFCIVFPKLDAVLAITAATDDMQGMLDCVWSHLLPGLKDSVLGDGHPAAGALSSRLAELSLPPAAGARAAGTSATLPAVWSPAEVPSEREAAVRVLSIDESATGWLVTLADHGVEYVIACGYQAWTHNDLEVRAGLRLQIAASAAWTSGATFVAELAFVQTPHRLRVTCDASTATSAAIWNAVPLGSPGFAVLALDSGRHPLPR
jgi:CubicO group peptidase (beta-lactamase class C family)